MKLDEFTEALNEALIKRGVPEHIASQNVEKLSAHLNSDSFRVMDSYSSQEDLNEMADELSARLLSHLQSKENTGENNAQSHNEKQELESLNDAVNRAVGTATGYTGGEDGADNTNGHDAVSVVAPDADQVPDASPDSIGDIDFTACVEPTYAEASRAAAAGITFDEDDDVIELSASTTMNAAPFDDTIFTVPVPSDSVGDSVSFSASDSYSAGETEAYPFEPCAESTAAFSIPTDGISEYAPDDAMFTSLGLAHSTYEAEAVDTRGQKGAVPELPALPDIYENAEGKRKFRNTVICLSPLIAIGAVLYFAAWGLVFVAEAALIAALIAVLVAIAAAGTLSTITGIIYGIVRLSSRRGEGIFEIGLGIVTAGATLLAGVLIYNAALRLMPWVIRKTSYLCRLCCRCIHIRILQARGRFSEK